MIGLVDTVTVYTPDDTGAFTTVARAGLRCRLVAPNRQMAAQYGERAELADEARLLWEPGYVMPETAQIADAAGTRWNVAAGTLDAVRGAGWRMVYRRCQIVRVP